MTQISIDELKEKFSTVQNISQGLKEEKIRLESELSTLEKDYNEQVKELLEKTGGGYPGFISWFKQTVNSIRQFHFIR